MGSEKQKPVLSSRVSQKVMDRIDALVEETGVSRADVIERALALGLEDQEKFVGELKGVVSGPLMALLLNEKFLNVVMPLMGGEVDPNQMKAIKAIRQKAKGHGGKGKPALE